MTNINKKITTTTKNIKKSIQSNKIQKIPKNTKGSKIVKTCQLLLKSELKQNEKKKKLQDYKYKKLFF